MRIAAITMVYNEAWNLPLWIRHYSHEFGRENCFVIDHGSNDGSTSNLEGVNLIRLPRTPQNNELRTSFVGELSNNLLKYYDYVIYTDCDEMLVADPAEYDSITDYCKHVNPDYVTSIGIDVLHKGTLESELLPTELISHQRSYGHYTSAMNKPNITSTPVTWSPGFHSRIESARFDKIFLFHLRYADLSQTLKRLSITRDMEWSRIDAGGHQRVKDEEMIRWVTGWRGLPVVENDPWQIDQGRISQYLKEFKSSEVQIENKPCQVNTTIFGTDLLKIPERFRGKF